MDFQFRRFERLALVSALALLVCAPVHGASLKCVTTAPARASRVGQHWVALNQTVIRGAKPDVRATALELSLLRDSDGQVATATLPIVGIREALAKGAADGRISKTTKRGLMLDTFRLQLLHVSEDGVTLTFSMRSRGSARDSQYSLVTWKRGAKSVVVSKPILLLAPRQAGAVHFMGADATGALLLLTSVVNGDAAGQWRADAALHAVAKGQVKRLATFSAPVKRSRQLPFGKHFRLSADKSLLAVAAYRADPKGQSSVYVIRLGAKPTVSKIPGMATIYGLDFSADGATLAMVSNRENKIQLWSWAKGKLIREGKAPKRVHGLSYGASGKRLWVASKGGGLVALDAKRLRRVGKPFKFPKIAPVLYGQLGPRPSGQPQTFSFAKDKYGFGQQEVFCVGVQLP